MSFTSKHLAPSSQRLIEFMKKYNVCKERRSAFQPAGCTQQQREWNGGGRARCPAISAFPAHIQSEEERGRCLRHSLETRSTDAFSLTWLPPAERESCKDARGRHQDRSAKASVSQWCDRTRSWARTIGAAASSNANLWRPKWTEGHAVCEKESRAGWVRISAKTKC